MNSCAGTPAYMSPEMNLAKFNKMDETKFNASKSDVFSLGLVLLQTALLMNVEELRSKKLNAIH